LDKGTKRKINRLIALGFASVLLILVYGPLAQWFITADRFIYDQIATHLPNKVLDNAVIVSIDPAKVAPEDMLEQYGLVLGRLRQAEVRRIIMANPPGRIIVLPNLPPIVASWKCGRMPTMSCGARSCGNSITA
jgi:hypothetical protein